MAHPYRLLLIVGARPNFMKIAPIVGELARHPGVIESKLVHTGQHYDAAMSASRSRTSRPAARSDP